MMRTIVKIMVAGLVALAAVPAFGQAEGGANETIVLGKELAPRDTTRQHRFTNHLIAPKGEWQCGLSVMYADFNSEDNDYMMLLQGVSAKASLLRISPEAAYTFRDNHAIGIRLNYTKAAGLLDSATADLLGNLSLSVSDINATSTTLGGAIFQRTYIGIDKRGRFGITWDYVLGYTRSNTHFTTADASLSDSLKEKVSLSFAPGVVYFPMNNVSIQANISIADVSYAVTTAYDSGAPVGRHTGWSARASLNLLNLSFGLTIHL